MGELTLFVMSFAVCYGLAAVSWHFLESRFLRLKNRFEYVFAPATDISISEAIGD
jgi:peptidoglycan/LPS O-acetylase OafA/YrhL